MQTYKKKNSCCSSQTFVFVTVFELACSPSLISPIRQQGHVMTAYLNKYCLSDCPRHATVWFRMGSSAKWHNCACSSKWTRALWPHTVGWAWATVCWRLSKQTPSNIWFIFLSTCFLETTAMWRNTWRLAWKFLWWGIECVLASFECHDRTDVSWGIERPHIGFVARSKFVPIAILTAVPESGQVLALQLVKDWWLSVFCKIVLTVVYNSWWWKCIAQSCHVCVLVFINCLRPLYACVSYLGDELGGSVLKVQVLQTRSHKVKQHFLCHSWLGHFPHTNVIRCRHTPPINELTGSRKRLQLYLQCSAVFHHKMKFCSLVQLRIRRPVKRTCLPKYCRDDCVFILFRSGSKCWKSSSRKLNSTWKGSWNKRGSSFRIELANSTNFDSKPVDALRGFRCNIPGSWTKKGKKRWRSTSLPVLIHCSAISAR